MGRDTKDDLVVRRGKNYFENFTVNSRRFRRSLKTDCYETAVIIATKNKSDALLGKLAGKRPEMTLDAALARYWLEHAHMLKSAISAKLHSIILRRGLGAETLLSEITRAVLVDYAKRRSAGKITHSDDSLRKGTKIAPATVNNELKLMNAVMCMARDEWGVEARGLNMRKIYLKNSRYRQNILGQSAVVNGYRHEGQQERLFRVLRPDYHGIVRFGLVSGVRFDNIVTLTWEQVKWAEGHIEFRVKSDEPEGRLFYLPITKAIAAILSVELERHPQFVFTYICQHGHRRHRLVKGQRYPFTRGGFFNHWDDARRAAGLWYEKRSPRNFRFHDLRHTAATRVLRKTRNLKTVQKMLGHESLSSTARYASVDVEDVRNGMDEADAQSSHIVIVGRKKTV